MGRFAWHRPRPTIRSGADPLEGSMAARGLDRAFRDGLEEELVSQFRAQRVRRRRGTFAMTMQKNAFRWAAIAVALGLGIVACSTPTTTELELGQQLSFTVPVDPADRDATESLFENVRAMEAMLSQRPGLEVATVTLSADDAATTLDLVVFGDDLDPDALVRELTTAYPVLGTGTIETEPLHTEIREPLYAKLSRQVLHLEVGGGSEEEIAARILEQLRAQGFDEGSKVQVQKADGTTTLQINAVGEGVVEETVIEVVGDELPETIEIGGTEGESGEHVIVERVKKQ